MENKLSLSIPILIDSSRIFMPAPASFISTYMINIKTNMEKLHYSTLEVSGPKVFKKEFRLGPSLLQYSDF